MISNAQRDFILGFVSPYLNAIKAQAPDSQTAKNWLVCAAKALTVFGLSAKCGLPNFLHTVCQSGHDKPKAFYNQLFGASLVYQGMADLEEKLERLGDQIPDQLIIQDCILTYLDK